MNFPLSCQASTIVRFYLPAPENRMAPEDDDLAGNIEENIEVVKDSDTSVDEEEKEEEEEADDAVAFIAKRRRGTVDELTDTVESSPSSQNDDDVDQIPLARQLLRRRPLHHPRSRQVSSLTRMICRLTRTLPYLYVLLKFLTIFIRVADVVIFVYAVPTWRWVIHLRRRRRPAPKGR
jgi:Flp pilus assembly protein TadB